MGRTLSIIGIALGVLLLVAAGIVRWVVAPAKAVLPSDLNTTRTYTGTAATLLNASALTSGGQVLLTNVPITVPHTTKVLATKGSSAEVSDVKTVTAGGQPVASVDYKYAVNRTNLGRGSGFSGVIDQTGLTFNWPIRTQKKDYTGWVSDTHTTTPLHYTGTANRGGISTYVFTATTTATPITDSQVLATLPQSLPKASLVTLAGGLNLPAGTLAGLQQALPTLPDPVQFKYTYQVDATYWVAPESGVVVDVKEHEVRTLGLVVGGVAVPVTPVLDITFTSSPSQLAATVADAKDKDSKVSLVYGGLPIGLLIAGVVLLLAGIVGLALMLRRRSAAGPTSTATDGEPAVENPVET